MSTPTPEALAALVEEPEKLARAVLRAYGKDDAAFIRLFGSNGPALGAQNTLQAAARLVEVVEGLELKMAEKIIEKVHAQVDLLAALERERVLRASAWRLILMVRRIQAGLSGPFELEHLAELEADRLGECPGDVSIRAALAPAPEPGREGE